jgi:WhiB family redox-sensing transcriptional regulator
MANPNPYLRTFTRADWMTDAACKDLPVEMFFPERGRDGSRARAVCAECPVQRECADYAIGQGLRHGIWGGMSERRGRSGRRALRLAGGNEP